MAKVLLGQIFPDYVRVWQLKNDILVMKVKKEASFGPGILDQAGNKICKRLLLMTFVVFICV